MGSTPDLNLNLQEAIERHKAVLKQNLEVWKKVKVDEDVDEHVKLAAVQGYQETLIMTNAWAELDAILSKPKKARSSKDKAKRQSADSEMLPVSSFKRRRLTAENQEPHSSATVNYDNTPVVDASGLFMIDPNPSKIETLLSQNQANRTDETPQKKKKRRRSEQQDHDAQSQAANSEPTSRAKRRRADSASKSSERTEIDTGKPNQPQNDAAGNDSPHRQAFEAKVALRLKEKEEQRKGKSHKKRKRSSEISNMADEAGEEDEPFDVGGDAGTSKQVRKPRAKKVKSTDTVDNEADNESKKTRSQRRSKSRSAE